MQLRNFARGPLPTDPSVSVAFGLSDLWQEIRKNNGPAALIGDLKTAAEVIACPYQVRYGGDCYLIVGKPSTMYINAFHQAPAPRDSLFLVSVDRGLTLCDCWRALPWLNFPDLPADQAEERFLDSLGPLVAYAA